MLKEDVMGFLEGCLFLLMLPWIAFSELARETVMRGAQGNAKKGLTLEQRRLLDELWYLDLQYEGHIEFRGGLVSEDFLEACRQHKKQIEEKVVQCGQAGIDEKQILAFRVATHNYWWSQRPSWLP